MKYFILSLLCLATSMNAGKDKAAKQAEKQAAAQAAAAALAASTPQNTNKCDVNCPGLQNGGCWKCNTTGVKQQGQYDRK